jgi:hypothetical protein
MNDSSESWGQSAELFDMSERTTLPKSLANFAGDEGAKAKRWNCRL